MENKKKTGLIIGGVIAGLAALVGGGLALANRNKESEQVVEDNEEQTEE